MFQQKFFLFVVVFAVMAIIYATGAPTDVEDPSENDETFCRPFSSCSSSTDCASFTIYRTCRTRLFGNKQCCLF
ncbi:Uncharacterized protein APZ42_023617 [Daphnia magna]|uniref:Uncharacterized protein n=2 Tax=Daphnia magna TaxID=35525 RepID=A0ABQ9ZIR3_9CRUS|nr:hypothetical protein OUZ56_024699 [Daphnia magna]KZS11702.1 Uncharacterized protein APZ42_023617 [Daphnia magna]